MSEVFVVLFRGVGGKTQLPVARLREALVAAGFENVATYINSGNAVVKSSLGRGDVVDRIGQICAREFDFRKDIHALTRREWAGLIAGNPFPDAVTDGKTLHAAVLDQAPAAANLAALQAVADGGDRIDVVGKVAYLHTPNGFGRSKLAEKFDKGIGVANTARNWNTVLKLDALASEAAR